MERNRGEGGKGEKEQERGIEKGGEAGTSRTRDEAGGSGGDRIGNGERKREG